MVVGVVVPQHDAIDGDFAAIRSHVLFHRIPVVSVCMRGVHHQHAALQPTSPLLHTHGIAPPRRRVRVVRDEVPEIHLLGTARVVLAPGDDLPADLRAACRVLLVDVRASGADLVHKAMVQVIQPWIAVDVVLVPWHDEPHCGKDPHDLEHALSAGLAHDRHVDVRKVQDDPGAVSVRINRPHAPPHRAEAATANAEGDAEDPIEDLRSQRKYAKSFFGCLLPYKRPPNQTTLNNKYPQKYWGKKRSPTSATQGPGFQQAGKGRRPA